jgi:hypothetical protein
MAEVELMPLANNVPKLSIRIPPDVQEKDGEDYEYDRFSDNESDGDEDEVDIRGWLDEVDPDWESSLNVSTTIWSMTVTIRVSEKVYYALHKDVHVMDAIRNWILIKFLWKTRVRFEF